MAKDQSGSVRHRLSIPAVDTSVTAWCAAQDNLSLSLRMLIRERIERDGFEDVAFRPVAQQPKKGRPKNKDRTQTVSMAPVPVPVPAATVQLVSQAIPDLSVPSAPVSAPLVQREPEPQSTQVSVPTRPASTGSVIDDLMNNA